MLMLLPFFERGLLSVAISAGVAIAITLIRAARATRLGARKRRLRCTAARQPLRLLDSCSAGDTAAFELADGRNVSRTVRRMDALDFLAQNDVLDGYVVTSLPDIVELNLHDLAAYRRWLAERAEEIFARLPPRSIAIFYQSDAKLGGEWLDKSHVIQTAIASLGGTLLWHKIALFTSCGDFSRVTGRPQYSHVLAFGKDVRNDEAWLLSAATPDVLLRGEMPWARAMGIGACEAACKLVAAAVAHEAGQPGAPSGRIIDPFCGMGTILAVANEFGLDALGVELNLKRSVASRRLVLLRGEESSARRSGAVPSAATGRPPPIG